MDISHQETNSSHETSFNKNLPLAKLHKFVAIMTRLASFNKEIQTVEEVLREFETVTTRFCSYYAKCFAKKDQGKENHVCTQEFKNDKCCCVQVWKSI